MISPAAELARRLAERAEAVCRHYLSSGCRSGRYWIVGDVGNRPGRSMYVRLHGPSCGHGAAGRWRDAATGESGDLLDLVRLNLGCESFADALAEARWFLREPTLEPLKAAVGRPAARSSTDAARRLFAMGRPIRKTHAEAYLLARGITAALDDLPSLRFHPRCYRGDRDDVTPATLPALLAAITDVNGEIVAVQRTWLHPTRPEKAPVADPRRSLGRQLGGGVRLGLIDDVLVVGEGVETMLSLRTALPRLPVLAGLSADHLAALDIPAGVTRLYVALDDDRAGRRAEARLRTRMAERGVECLRLIPAHRDFNADLQKLGIEVFRARLLRQLSRDDAVRFAAER